jgi:hypothetical protein
LTADLGTTTNENIVLENIQMRGLKLGIGNTATRKLVNVQIDNCNYDSSNGSNDIIFQCCKLANVKLGSSFNPGATGNLFANVTFTGDLTFDTAAEKWANAYVNCVNQYTGRTFSLNENLRIVTVTSTEAVGELVYNTGTADTYNRADGTDITKQAQEVIVYKPATTLALVKPSGLMGGYVGLTIGAPIYATTAGGITQTDNGSDPVGYAQDATTAMYNIKSRTKAYGSMYLNDNASAQVIETANTPIGLRNFTTGTVFGFTYDAGNTGAITAFADYSGTVAGTVLATCATHGLTTGDYITIRGTTSYNGLFQITKVDDNTFYFTDTWVADDATGDFDQPAHLVCNVAGTYDFDWNMTLLEATTGGSDVSIVPYINATAQVKSKAVNTMGDAIKANMSGGDQIALVANDWVYLTASSSGVLDITCSNGNFKLTKI